ncbi:hypothetical protein [Abyssisolibacter fermentans]|uniref:hypothetical protein n=1 Tax=Abyssisolibacter fermentans TaxID=1766203 RepID=UPI00082DFA2D|nr:hypothetical protein [Abyssisolibacter fermentans]
MIRNLLDTFKKAYEIKGDDLVIENHNLKEGLYIKINQNSEIETAIIKKDSPVNKQYQWFRKADFYSSIVSINKCIKDKKIHSSNYLSVFMKKENVIDTKKTKALPTEEILKKLSIYYDVIISSKFNSEEIDKELGVKLDVEKYKFCKDFMLKKFDVINELVIKNDNEFDKYIKIFFDFNDWDLYKQELNRYLFVSVFLKNDFNTKYDNTVYGLSSMNMALDDKKKFLKHKSLRFSVPFRISAKDAVLLFKYSKWLKVNKLGANFKTYDYDYKIPLKDIDIKNNEDKYYILLYLNKKDDIEFEDFDIVPAFNEKINFTVENYIGARNYNSEIKGYLEPNYSDYNGKNTKSFLKALDEGLYNKKLIYSFNKKLNDIKPTKWDSKSFCNILILTKNQAFDFIYKNDYIGLREAVSKYYVYLVIENIKTNLLKGKNACNVYFALKKFFNLGGDEIVNKISKLRNSIGDYIKNEDIHDLENVVQYSFLAGQIAFYLINQSASANKNHDVVERMINCKRVEGINNELKYWFKRFAHAVSLNYRKFNKAFSMVLAFDHDENIDEDIFLAGYLGDNIFYEKKGDIKNEIKE